MRVFLFLVVFTAWMIHGCTLEVCTRTQACTKVGTNDPLCKGGFCKWAGSDHWAGTWGKCVDCTKDMEGGKEIPCPIPKNCKEVRCKRTMTCTRVGTNDRLCGGGFCKYAGEGKWTGKYGYCQDCTLDMEGGHEVAIVCEEDKQEMCKKVVCTHTTTCARPGTNDHVCNGGFCKYAGSASWVGDYGMCEDCTLEKGGKEIEYPCTDLAGYWEKRKNTMQSVLSVLAEEAEVGIHHHHHHKHEEAKVGDKHHHKHRKQ